MDRFKKRLGTTFLLLICLGLLPLGAAAAGETDEKRETETLQGAQTMQEAKVLVETETLEGTNGEAADNDALFASYLEGLFTPETESTGLELWRSKKTFAIPLTEKEKFFYDRFLEHFTKIAAGQQESTYLTLTVEDLVSATQCRSSWSAEELGLVGNIVETAGSQVFTRQAKNKVLSLFLDGLNLDKVLYYLEAKEPQVFYWYDKTEGYKLDHTFAGDDFKLGLKGNLVFRFAVASAYSQTGTLKTYSVNTAKGQAAHATLARAQSIVSKYVDASDYDKLKGYCEEICDLVEYNNAALGRTVPYGDPWQVIYVFDGDPATDVVCEGYAKAFQYLCNLTKFESSAIRCHTVIGELRTPTSWEGHMWNVVTMDDGKNYIMDVTNCDSDSIGTPTGLFLVGGTEVVRGQHYTVNALAQRTITRNGVSEVQTKTTLTNYTFWKSNMGIFDDEELVISDTNYQNITHTDSMGPAHVLNLVEAKDPTCKAEGNIRHYVCAACGKFFTDASGKKELTRAEVMILTVEHQWTVGSVNRPGGCDTAGTVTYTCASCGETRTETVAAGQHVWDEGQTTPATCETAGSTVYTCQACKQTRTETIPALGHAWGEWTVTAAGCEKSGERSRVCANNASHVERETIPATGHAWNEGVVTTPATCGMAGVRTFTCANCGQTRLETIPALVHAWGEWTVTVPATPNQDGVETRACANDAKHTESRSIPKLTVPEDFLDVGAYKSGGTVTYPTREGKIFAGWYTDATCGEAFTGSSGYAYPKFVDAGTLTVRWQVRAGITEESEETDLRLITTVDSLAYRSVGFEITVGNRSINRVSDTVYKNVLGWTNGSFENYTPDLFSQESQWFMVYRLNHIDKSEFGSEITVKPVWETLDGTKVTGAARTFRITDDGGYQSETGGLVG